MDQKKGASASSTIIAWSILAVPVMFFMAFIVFPFFTEWSMAYQKYSLVGNHSWIGLKNFEQVRSMQDFWRDLGMTFVSPSVMIRAALMTFGSLAIALLVAEARLAGRKLVIALLSLLAVLSNGTVFSAVVGFRGFSTHMLHDYSLWLFKAAMAAGLGAFLPLGAAFLLAAMHPAAGARLSGQAETADTGTWKTLRRPLAALGICAYAFAIISIADIGALRGLVSAEPGQAVSFFSLGYRIVLLNWNFGEGSAMLIIGAIMLLILGTILSAVLEFSGREIVLGLKTPAGSSLFGSEKRNPGRKGRIAASAVIIACVAAFIYSFWSRGSVISARMGRELMFLARGFQNTTRIAIMTAFLGTVISAAAGFALGALRPRGGRALLGALGAFSFLTPAVLAIPLFLSFTGIKLLNDFHAIALPLSVCPLAILYFTWFFRGLAEDQPGSWMKPVLLACLPCFAVFSIIALNATLLPFILLNDAKLFPLALSFSAMAPGPGVYFGEASAGGRFLGAMAFAAPYAPAIGLLIVSAIAVFPRFALKIGERSKERVFVSSKSVLGALALALYCVAGVLAYLGGNKKAIAPAYGAAAAALLASILAMVSYYAATYRTHRALAAGGTYRYSAAGAVARHFIPVYGLYWIFAWTREASKEIAARDGGKPLMAGAFLAPYYLCLVASVVVPLAAWSAASAIISLALSALSSCLLMGMGLNAQARVQAFPAPGEAGMVSAD